MSQDFNDPELFADFIVEAKEHLETIEPNLLELEKAPDNLALLNEIFRPMHSLKGASGFLGLNRINMIAHKAENILDELRKGAMVVTSEIMDVILLATDALRQMIDNLETTSSEGEVQIEPIMDLIDAIMNGDIPAPLVVNQTEESSGAEAETTTDQNAGEDEAEIDAEAEAEEVAESATDPEDTPGTDDPSDSDSAAQNGDAAAKGKSSGSDDDNTLSVSTWIEQLAKGKPYALTAFGEGHLKDFMDEAREITENLSTGLLELERNEDADSELVNDLFRYFHNLKGNSGIIGFHELNSLTHEAETLFNRVRHGEMEVSHELVDLLLLVVDVMDNLSEQIDPTTGSVTPVDITEILEQLQQVVAGGPVALPKALAQAAEKQAAAEAAAEVEVASDAEDEPDEQSEQALGTDSEAEAVESASENVDEASEPSVVAQVASDDILPAVILPVGLNRDEDDLDVFKTTVLQQQEIIRVALAELSRDSSQKEFVDALFRSFTAIQKPAGFMGFKELSQYAERTAGLVNQGRSSDLDFSLMTDLLSQEAAIIGDMVTNEVTKARAAAAQEATAAQEAATAQKAATPLEATTPATKTAESAKPVAAKTDATKPTEAVKPAAAAPKVTAPAVAPKVAAPKPAAPAATAPKPVAPVATVAKAAVPAVAGKPAEPNAEHKASSTIRVDHEKLDHLMNLIGELIINRNRYTVMARQLEGIDDAKVADIAQNLSEATYAMARISDDLQDTIMKVRMVPVSSVFSRFPRLVRDLSRKSGKEVDLILEGEETELDKSVVEVIGDPLTHLIRNAVDHGVEGEADRVARGKPAKGRVVLRAYHKGNSVAIEIEDDGKGLDPEKLREVAVRKGLMSMEEARQLDDREAQELIFAPGFSSAEKITEISGRGVGMDVVRTNIKTLKGSINITSEVGKGTRFTLSLPLTLAIIDALMITVAGETYAIPLDAVSETTKIEAKRLTDIKGRKAVTLRGEVLGIMELSDLLGLPRKDLPEVLSVVVIHDNDRRLGLVVDRMLERQEIVIKPLGSYLGDVRGISGATIMGDGSVILILDPHEVYLMATSNSKGGSSL